jgi:hypothetical protein
MLALPLLKSEVARKKWWWALEIFGRVAKNKSFHPLYI